MSDPKVVGFVCDWSVDLTPLLDLQPDDTAYHSDPSSGTHPREPARQAA